MNQYEAVTNDIIRINKKLTPDKLPNLVSAIRSMGPGCIFDDAKNDDQLIGMHLILAWIECELDSK